MNKQTYLCLMLLFTSTLMSANPFSKNTATAMAYSDIQRVRIDFTMPTGYIKHLLLGFTPNNAASDGVDYGYDALSLDNFPNDLNWIIEDENYVIQGVGAFQDNKQYPLSMFISNAGDISIALDTLENFDSDIDVFLFDALYNTYTLLNDLDFQENVDQGTHLDRYFIAFKNNTNGSVYNSSSDVQLSINENDTQETSVSFLRKSKEIYITSNQNISKLEVYDLLGKRLFKQENIQAKTWRLSTPFIKQNYGIVRVYNNQGITNKKLLFH
ncbi:hypothetical protein FG167_15915 [Lacinutrix sp. WUR7]|uniref:hypothetical protein n=1 Tax=Lacinutrix sp. WUR7 TaxID=2653681 RepID=UPI00193DCA27|nr:hypothetical protein [Lacinutrix sp. WUR7]QRM90658.1 hypothetical protein FG167_15915 [Lacinutrix sp. WUR7]